MEYRRKGGGGLLEIIVEVFAEPDARLLSIRLRRQSVSAGSGFDCHARHLQPGAHALGAASGGLSQEFALERTLVRHYEAVLLSMLRWMVIELLRCPAAHPPACTPFNLPLTTQGSTCFFRFLLVCQRAAV